MSEGASQLGLTAGKQRMLALVEIVLIMLVFFVIGGETPPHDNEAHYLCRLKHFWNPDWCQGDLFLDSADAQVVFIWTFGWVTRFLSLPATAWVGRIVAWSLLAWAWQRLSWRLVPRPFFAVLSAALFLTLNGLLHLAGEWIVGGVEAKCFAYVFVMLALREMLDERWNRVWLLLGAATAFHPIVGGWCVVLMGCVWCISQLQRMQKAKFQSQNSLWKTLWAMMPGLVGGGLIALLGVVPALRLTWGESPEIVAKANQIYVFDRLPHHLALLALPAEEVMQRVRRHAVLLAAMWLLTTWAVRSLRASDGDRIKEGNNVSPANDLRRIAWFAWGAAALAVFGFAIEFALTNEPLVAAKWLRYYWFRMTDFAAPLAAALACAMLLSAAIDARRKWAPLGLAVAVALVGWHLADKSAARLANPVPPADRKLQDFAAWVDVCEWIAANTEAGAVFLTPRANQSFKWRTGRSEVVTRKDMPQDARSIMAWYERYQHIYYEYEGNGVTDAPPSLGQLGTVRVRQLAKEFGAKYVVTGQGKPLWLPVLYPNVLYANEEYVVYRVDDGESTNGKPVGRE